MDATTIGGVSELPATAQRLRASALKLYARQGPAGTGVREIAADAGAAPGLIRHHFGSKAGLTRAVDDLVLSVITETLETATAQAAPSDPTTRVRTSISRSTGAWRKATPRSWPTQPGGASSTILF